MKKTPTHLDRAQTALFRATRTKTAAGRRAQISIAQAHLWMCDRYGVEPSQRQELENLHSYLEFLVRSS